MPRVGLVAAPLVFLAVWFAPAAVDPSARHAVAIVAMMIVLWATEAVNHSLAGLFGMVLFWALRVSPFESAFSGFWNEAPWFLLGALVIGAMTSRSGLAQRIAYAVTSRVGASYGRLLLAFILVDFLLTPLVPSGVARVAVLGTLVAGTIEALGLSRRSNIGRGLMIVVSYAATIFDKTIMAGTVAILARGIIQDAAHVSISYSRWFIAFVPCDLITIFCCWWLIPRLFPPERQDFEGGVAYLRTRLAALGPISAAEKRCAGLLAVALTLWMTDFLHHLAPTTVALGVAAAALVPKVGVLRVRDLRGIDFGIVCFPAAALSMSRVLTESQGLAVLTNALLGWMAPLLTAPAVSALVLYWTAFVYHLFLGSETAMVGSSLPAVLQFAAAHGMNAVPVGMMWTFASGAKMFAYQSAVLIVGYSFGYFDARDLLKVGFVLSVVESIVLLLLVPFYWPLIGVS